MTRALAGDFDYDTHGSGYSNQRRTDPRIAALVHAALGDARTVLNVGAGAGSYQPDDRYVVAVEPSAAMRAQRPASAIPAIDATAKGLPFDDDTFDAVMAAVTVHQWSDTAKGLAELRRVSRGPYARPERFLDPRVRAAQSAWGFVEPDAITAGMERLRADLESGAWDARYGHLRTQTEFIGSLRLLVGRP